MKLTVLGCHGGESKRHRPTSFRVDRSLAIDAGAITRALTVHEQEAITSILVSHAHFDHVRDLALLADNRCQVGGPTIEIVGAAPTIAALQRHFFNDVLWPDFTKIPSGDGPTIAFRTIGIEKPEIVAGYEVTAVEVTHTIDAVGFLVSDREGTLAFSGDTGPTQRFWELTRACKDLSGILLEVSFPDAERELALTTGHLCPSLAREELKKLGKKHADVPVYFHHLKPVFAAKVTDELEHIDDRSAHVCRLDHEIELVAPSRRRR